MTDERKESRRKRRGRSEGSVYQRADGMWVASVSVGFGGDGKRRRRVVYAATKTEVLDKLREIQAKAGRALDLGAGKMSVGDYLAHWLENVVKPGTRKSTSQRYEQAVNLHIVPVVGGVRLAMFTPSHVESLYSELRRNGKSPRQIQMCGTVLGTAMRHAVRRKLIEANPVSDIRKDRPAEREPTFLTAAHAKRFLVAREGSRYYALFHLALASGMRQGELFALQWQDLCLEPERGAVSVRRTVTPVKGNEFIVGEPKTKSSKRTIGIPADVVESLLAHRAAMLREGRAAKDHLVFCNRAGGFISRTNFLRREHGVAISKANAAELEAAEKESRPADLIPEQLRFHDLRHTHASLLLSAGHSLKAVSARLGHAGVEITLKVYAHCMPGDDAKLTSGIGELLKRA